MTGSGHPTCGFVYKLVARADSDDPQAELLPVAKKSTNKNTVGGRKFAMRRFDAKGRAEAEIVGIGTPPTGDANDRQLMVPLVENGTVVGREPIEKARERHEASRKELPKAALRVSKGEPAIPTIILDHEGDETYNPYLHSAVPTNI